MSDLSWRPHSEKDRAYIAHLSNGEEVRIVWWYARDRYQYLKFRGVKHSFSTIDDAKKAADLMNLMLGEKEIAPTLTPLEQAERILDTQGGTPALYSTEEVVQALQLVVEHLKESEG